jgi:acyl-CoA reductase-like NAD-dependent aldehyde dehydrogenase
MSAVLSSEIQNRVNTQDLLIDGRRVRSVAGRYFDTVNPATEQVIARVAEADADDVDATGAACGRPSGGACS